MRPLLLAPLVFALALGCTPEPPAQSATSTTSMPAPAPAPAPAQAAVAVDLSVGQAAPDFAAVDQDGKPVHLADMKGHFVVVYFYPKDETPLCTHEACAFRDGWNDLQKKGVFVIGISADNAESHKAFAQSHQLPFALVSDPNGDIAAKYSVPVDKAKGHINRQSFVVAPDGSLKKIYRKVDVTVHAQQIAEDTAS